MNLFLISFLVSCLVDMDLPYSWYYSESWFVHHGSAAAIVSKINLKTIAFAVHQRSAIQQTAKTIAAAITTDADQTAAARQKVAADAAGGKRVTSLSATHAGAMDQSAEHSTDAGVTSSAALIAITVAAILAAQAANQRNASASATHAVVMVQNINGHHTHSSQKKKTTVLIITMLKK